MQRAWLVGALVVVAALAGCTQPPPEPLAGDGRTDGTGDTRGNATLGGNVSAGNTTVSGNATAGGNATGNFTGNTTGNTTGPGNGTANATAKVLHNETHSYSGTAPADAEVTVPEGLVKLTATANAAGLILGLRVTLLDPGGNATPLLDGGETEGSADLRAPDGGTWILRFEGAGAGEARVEIVGA